MVGIILGGVAAYVAIGAWTWGYCGGLDGQGESITPTSPQHGLGYYHDEGCAWWPAVLWPFSLVFLVGLRPLARLGYRRGLKELQAKKTRIELQEKLRVELKEAEEALENDIQLRRGSRTNNP